MKRLTIRESLLAMGYIECKRGRWIKPVGYQCFSYDIDTNQWSNWFKTISGKTEAWETKSLSHDEKSSGSYLDQLKYCECFTRTDVCLSSSFELATIDL